jgi:hypothetical protein
VFQSIHSSHTSDQGELYTWGWPLHIESVLHLGAQFDRFPAFVQGMQQRPWASYLPERINFRRAQTTPLLQPELAGKRFRTVAVGASFYIAVDGLLSHTLVTPPLSSFHDTA